MHTFLAGFLFHTTVVTDGPLLVLDSQLSCGEGTTVPLDDLVDCLLLMELQVETLHSSWNPVQADPSSNKGKRSPNSSSPKQIRALRPEGMTSHRR